MVAFSRHSVGIHVHPESKNLDMMRVCDYWVCGLGLLNPQQRIILGLHTGIIRWLGAYVIRLYASQTACSAGSGRQNETGSFELPLSPQPLKRGIGLQNCWGHAALFKSQSL